MGDVTQLIAQARNGDALANDALYRTVYDDLHRIAGRVRPRNDALAPGSTSLVHDAYFRLANPQALGVSDRKHFFSIAARAMRQIVIDRARARLTTKRGGGAVATTLTGNEALSLDSLSLERLVELDAAMRALDAHEPRLARLVELRLFSGLSLDEAGEVLELSTATLKRDYRKAIAFLHAWLGDDDADDGPLG